MANDGIAQDVVDEYLRPALERMTQNRDETGHPYHHLTRSGVIVDGDPHAHVMHEEYLWEAGIAFPIPKSVKRPQKAVRLIPDWYNTKAGKRWLKAQSMGGIVQAAPMQHSLWV